ncbi:MAG: hypothetical protein [Microvirus sp.]|nr:MAG: hypothetical protein [Microvirus sp.]
MSKRKHLSNKSSQRMFSRHARAHPKNTPSALPMRGGIRL